MGLSPTIDHPLRHPRMAATHPYTCWPLVMLTDPFRLLQTPADTCWSLLTKKQKGFERTELLSLYSAIFFLTMKYVFNRVYRFASLLFFFVWLSLFFIVFRWPSYFPQTCGKSMSVCGTSCPWPTQLQAEIYTHLLRWIAPSDAPSRFRGGPT